MTTFEVLALVLVVLVMLVGLLGSVLPGLPGTPLIMAAAVVHKVFLESQGARWWVLLVLAVLMLVSMLADYLGSVYGARKLGASRRGVIGAILGGLIGFFFGLPGILLGPFVGAVLLEFSARREWRASTKAGLGAALGLVMGAAGKAACGAAMIGLFAADVLYRELSAPYG